MVPLRLGTMSVPEESVCADMANRSVESKND